MFKRLSRDVVKENRLHYRNQSWIDQVIGELEEFREEARARISEDPDYLKYARAVKPGSFLEGLQNWLIERGQLLPMKESGSNTGIIVTNASPQPRL